MFREKKRKEIGPALTRHWGLAYQGRKSFNERPYSCPSIFQVAIVVQRLQFLLVVVCIGTRGSIPCSAVFPLRRGEHLLRGCPWVAFSNSVVSLVFLVGGSDDSTGVSTPEESLEVRLPRDFLQVEGMMSELCQHGQVREYQKRTNLSANCFFLFRRKRRCISDIWFTGL